MGGRYDPRCRQWELACRIQGGKICRLLASSSHVLDFKRRHSTATKPFRQRSAMTNCIPKMLCLLAPLLLCACSERRTWYIPPGEEPTTTLPGVGTVRFLDIRNRDDYLRVALVIHNEQAAPLHFAPPSGAGPWGIQVALEDVTVATARVEGASESLTYVEPGQWALFDCLWRLYPPAPNSDWKWKIHINGLRIGETDLPPLILDMPKMPPAPGEEMGHGKLR